MTYFFDENVYETNKHELRFLQSAGITTKYSTFPLTHQQMESFEYSKKNANNLYFTDLTWQLVANGNQPVGYIDVRDDRFRVNGIQVNTDSTVIVDLVSRNDQISKMIKLTKVPQDVCTILQVYARFRKFLIPNSRLYSSIRDYFYLGTDNLLQKFITDIMILDQYDTTNTTNTTIMVYYADKPNEEVSENCVKLSLPTNQKTVKLLFKNKIGEMMIQRDPKRQTPERNVLNALRF